MIVSERFEDITKATQPLIAHGVNCQGVMGAGVAKAIIKKWPQVKESYNLFTHSAALLGAVQHVKIHDTLTILNCFTQEFYGPGDKQYVDYNAVATCFWRISQHYPGQDLAIPRIGSGLAGGDWKRIWQIVDHESRSVRVHVYTLTQNKRDGDLF